MDDSRPVPGPEAAEAAPHAAFLASCSLRDVLHERSHPVQQPGNSLPSAVRRERVVTLSHDDSVAYAMAKLSSEHILSAPVFIYPSAEAPDEPPTYLAVVDVSDLLACFISDLVAAEGVTETELAEELAKGLLPLSELMSDLERRVGDRFGHRKLITVVHGSDDGTLVPGERGFLAQSLLQAIRSSYLRTDHRLRGASHRLIVYGLDGRVECILSMSDIIAFLSTRLLALGPICDSTVEELGLATKPILSVPSHSSTMEAFLQLKATHLSAVAVVDGEGKLVASLSVSDFRGLDPSHLGVLVLPVLELLALIHGHPKTYGSGSTAAAAAEHPFFRATDRARHQHQQKHQQPPLVTTVATEPLGAVIALLADRRVHRVWVVDGRGHPTSVITLTDVLEILSTPPSR